MPTERARIAIFPDRDRARDTDKHLLALLCTIVRIVF
jgi:hypothetical protein